jgi:hypothetical protein
MLRLRFVGRVPKNAVNVAYVESKPLTPRESVSMVDMSHRRAENLAIYSGGEFNLRTTSGRVDTQDIVLSTRSVLSKNVRTPTPLYYQYVVGRPAAEDLRVVANVSPANLQLARLEILKTLQILDRSNNKIKGPPWDIEVTAVDGNGNFFVTLYLARLQTEAETFKLRYAAATAAGSTLPNHIEVINATPLAEPGSGFTLTQQANGYQITGLANTADGLGIFYTGSGANGQVRTVNGPPAAQVELWQGSWQAFMTGGKSLRELAAEINKAGLDYLAVALSDSNTTRLQVVASTPVYSYGLALKQYDITRVRYNEKTRVRPLRPYDDIATLPWYPRVDRGEFTQQGTWRGASHLFHFKPQGAEYQATQAPYTSGRMTLLDEKPRILDPHTVQLRRPNVDPNSVDVRIAGATVPATVEDYDRRNSVLFLSERLADINDVSISYAYEEASYVYTGVNLNPTGWHSPELLGKYVGVYMTPANVVGVYAQSFERTIWHAVADDVPTLLQNVANVKFSTGESAEALLLGIYYVGSPAVLDDQTITDTRTRGGGLHPSVEPRKLGRWAREAEMFNDISAYDGEPFPPTAVIGEFPNEMLGTGTPDLRRDPAADPSGFFYPSGLLDRSDVQSKLDRYKAGGVLGILDPEDILNG